MITVVLSGVPSSGKTTLARALSGVLTTFGHAVHHVEEAAKGTQIATTQHYLLSAKAQLDIQRRCGAAEYMVIDSPIFLYIVYAHRILRLTDEAEYAAYVELKALCAEETKAYRQPGCKLFHIQTDCIVDNEITNYIDAVVSAHVRLANHDLINRLEHVLSYLDLEWWNNNSELAPGILETACEMAEASILHEHTEGESNEI